MATLKITADDNGVVFDNGTTIKRRGLNSVNYEFVNEDTLTFLNAYDRETIDAARLVDLTLNGEILTVDNYDEKLKDALFVAASGGGGTVDAYTKAETDTLLLKKDTPYNNNTIYIRPSYTGSEEDGSYNKPFKTFNQAVVDKATELTQSGQRIDTFYFEPANQTYTLSLNYGNLTAALGITDSDLNFVNGVNPNLMRTYSNPNLEFLVTDPNEGKMLALGMQDLVEYIRNIIGQG